MSTPNYTLHKVDPSGQGTKVTFAGTAVIDEYKTETQVNTAISERCRLSMPSCESIASAISDAIKANAERGFSFSESGKLMVNIKPLGSFATAKGPWVPAVNKLRPTATTLGDVRAAYSAFTPVNTDTGRTPKIDNITDNTSGEEGVVRVNDTIYIAGDYFSLNSAKTDEKVEIIDADEVVKATATVSRSDRMSIDCTFASLPTAGSYYLRVKTRCGLGEDYELRSVKKSVTVM